MSSRQPRAAERAQGAAVAVRAQGHPVAVGQQHGPGGAVDRRHRPLPEEPQVLEPEPPVPGQEALRGLVVLVARHHVQRRRAAVAPAERRHLLAVDLEQRAVGDRPDRIAALRARRTRAACPGRRPRSRPRPARAQRRLARRDALGRGRGGGLAPARRPRRRPARPRRARASRPAGRARSRSSERMSRSRRARPASPSSSQNRSRCSWPCAARAARSAPNRSSPIRLPYRRRGPRRPGERPLRGRRNAHRGVAQGRPRTHHG